MGRSKQAADPPTTNQTAAREARIAARNAKGAGPAGSITRATVNRSAESASAPSLPTSNGKDMRATIADKQARVNTRVASEKEAEGRAKAQGLRIRENQNALTALNARKLPTQAPGTSPARLAALKSALAVGSSSPLTDLPSSPLRRPTDPGPAPSHPPPQQLSEKPDVSTTPDARPAPQLHRSTAASVDLQEPHLPSPSPPQTATFERDLGHWSPSIPYDWTSQDFPSGLTARIPPFPSTPKNPWARSSTSLVQGHASASLPAPADTAQTELTAPTRTVLVDIIDVQEFGQRVQRSKQTHLIVSESIVQDDTGVWRSTWSDILKGACRTSSPVKDTNYKLFRSDASGPDKGPVVLGDGVDLDKPENTVTLLRQIPALDRCVLQPSTDPGLPFTGVQIFYKDKRQAERTKAAVTFFAQGAASSCDAPSSPGLPSSPDIRAPDRASAKPKPPKKFHKGKETQLRKGERAGVKAKAKFRKAAAKDPSHSPESRSLPRDDDDNDDNDDEDMELSVQDCRKLRAAYLQAEFYSKDDEDDLPGMRNPSTAREALDRHKEVIAAIRVVDKDMKKKIPKDADRRIARQPIIREDIALALGYQAMSTFYTHVKPWANDAPGAPRILRWIEHPDAEDEEGNPLFDDLNEAQWSEYAKLVAAETRREERLQQEQERRRRRDRDRDRDRDHARDRRTGTDEYRSGSSHKRCRSYSLSSDNLDDDY